MGYKNFCSSVVLSFIFSFSLFGQEAEDSRGFLRRFIGHGEEVSSELLQVYESSPETIAAEWITQRFQAELVASLNQYGSAHMSRLLRAYAEAGVPLDVIREQIRSSTGTDVLDLSIGFKPEEMDRAQLMITAANKKLERIGIDFVRFVASESPTAESIVNALPEHMTSYNRVRWARVILAPSVAFGAALTMAAAASRVPLENGDFREAFLQASPALSVGVVAAFLEAQFSWFSSWWDRNVWKYKLGPHIVNILYPLALETAASLSASIATEYASHPVIHSSDAFTKIIGGAVFFTLSFGLFQTALNLMKARGELSESPRFNQESLAALYNTVGRVLFLATGNGAIGGFIQMSFFSGITLPAWLRSLVLDPAYDRGTRQIFERGAGCRSKLAVIGDNIKTFLSFQKT